MRKFLTIILLFFGLVGWGQTLPDSVWYQGYVIDVDTFLMDSGSSGKINQLKITYCADQLDNINNGYISAKSKCKLNGQSISTLFPNANIADTTFYMLENSTLNLNLTENLPYRLTRVYIFNSPLTGSDTTYYRNNFNQPFEATSTMFVVPDDYTLTGAISAATTEDTILLKDYSLSGAITLSKNLTLQGIGFVQLDHTTTLFNCNAAPSGTKHFNNLDLFVSTNIAITINNTNTDTVNVKNCNIGEVTAVYKPRGIINCENSNIYSQTTSTTDAKLTANDCYFHDISTPVFRVYNEIELNNCTFENNASDIIFNTTQFPNIIATSCNFNEPLYDYTSFNSSDLSFVGCNIDANSSFIRNTLLVTDTVNISFRKSKFTCSDSTKEIVRRRCKGNITFDSCDFTDFKGVILYTDDTTKSTIYDLVFSNNNLSDTTYRSIYALNMGGSITNNDMTNIEFYLFSDTMYYRDIDITDNNILLIDSSGFKIRGTINFENNSYIQDTTGILFLPGDSIIVLNNYFEFKAHRWQGNLVGMAGSDYNYFAGNNVIGHENVVENHLFNTSSNTYVYWNYIKKVTNACVSKRIDLTDHNFVTAYNVFDSVGTCIYFRNMRKGEAYNNKFINSIYRGDIFIDDNGGEQISDSCQIYNNISYNTNGMYFLRFNTTGIGDTLGLRCDHNIFTTGIYRNDLSDTLTFSEWQAFGFDLNSFNTDPLLDINHIPTQLSVARGNGKNLGRNYNMGIALGATYPNPLLDYQKAYWSIGTDILPLNKISTSNGKITTNNGKIVKY